MNPRKIYTRKTMGLDNRVWRLMMAMIIIPLALLSYRLSDETTCIPFSLTVKTLGIHPNGVFYTGETISFISSWPSKDIVWDFGDNTGSAGTTVYHQFLKEGIFKVTASSNSLCETGREIKIENPPVVPRQSDGVEGNIAGPASCYTYEDQIFTFTGPARSYEWSIPNHQSLGTRTGQTIHYTFAYAGKYSLQVELDGDRNKRHVLEVVVVDKVRPPKNEAGEKVGPLIPYTPPILEPQRQEEVPQVTKPVEPELIPAEPSNKKIAVSNGGFKEYLKEVVNKTKSVQDFDKYLCGGGGTPVIANGNKNDVKTFSWLCEEISGKKKKFFGLGKKKAEIVDVQLQKINGCVTIIEVHYKWQ